MRGETTTTTPSLVSREEEEEEEKSLFESLVLVTENFLHDDEKERLAEFVDRHVQLADAGCLRDDGEEEEDKEEEEEERQKTTTTTTTTTLPTMRSSPARISGRRMRRLDVLQRSIAKRSRDT